MSRRYKDAAGNEHIEIPLCKGCIEDLQEYNPYIDSEGRDIPLERIHPIEVDIEHCENTIITK